MIFRCKPKDNSGEYGVSNCIYEYALCFVFYAMGSLFQKGRIIKVPKIKKIKKMLNDAYCRQDIGGYSGY